MPSLVQTNRWHVTLLVFDQIARQVSRRGIFDAQPLAYDVADRFGLEFPNFALQSTPVWPPLIIRRAKVTAVQMGEFLYEMRHDQCCPAFQKGIPKRFFRDTFSKFPSRISLCLC